MTSRRLRLAAIVALLGLLVAWVGLDWWAGRRVSREIARLEARFGSIDGRSIASPNVPAEDNRARAVHAAALLIDPGRQGSRTYAAAGRFRLQPDSAGIPEDVRAFVESNREPMRVAELALTRRQSSWEADYAGSGPLPSWLAVRRLSQVLYAAARIDLAAGDAEDASTRLATGLAVSASIREEPSLIAQLIRGYAAVEQCESIRRLIATSEPSKEALARLAYWLDQNAESDPIQAGLRAELRWGNANFTAIEQGGSSDLWGNHRLWLELGRLDRPVIRMAHARYLRQMEQLIDFQAAPRPRPPLPPVSAPGRWSWRHVSDEPMLGLRQAVNSGDFFESVLAVTRTGVALRRYRLDHGAYPPDVSALAPSYLARLPIDPLTGRPPIYSAAGEGFALKADATGRSSGDRLALEWTVAK